MCWFGGVVAYEERRRFFNVYKEAEDVRCTPFAKKFPESAKAFFSLPWMDVIHGLRRKRESEISRNVLPNSDFILR